MRTPLARNSKSKAHQGTQASDLWINPRLNLKGPEGNRAWNASGNISPQSGIRFLELADIALGLKKPSTKRKKFAAATGAAAQTHATAEKTEPYTR